MKKAKTRCWWRRENHASELPDTSVDDELLPGETAVHHVYPSLQSTLLRLQPPYGFLKELSYEMCPYSTDARFAMVRLLTPLRHRKEELGRRIHLRLSVRHLNLVHVLMIKWNPNSSTSGLPLERRLTSPKFWIPTNKVTALFALATSIPTARLDVFTTSS